MLDRPEFYTLLILFAPVFLLPILFRGTALELRINRGSVYSLILYKSLIFVVPACLLVQYFGVGAFPRSFRLADDNITFFAGLWVAYGLFLFAFIFAICLRFLNLPRAVNSETLPTITRDEESFAWAAVLTVGIMLTIAIMFLEYRHAFIYSLITNEHLLRIRLDNTYHSRLPSQVSYLFAVCSWVLAIFSGRLLAERKHIYFFVIFVLALIGASVGGGKAPVVEVIFLLWVAKISMRPMVVSLPKVFFGGGVGAVLGLIVFFFVVRVQVPDMTLEEYWIYLANRAGVGQMTGVYESFAVGESIAGDFFWHIIPFASVFVDYPVYDKELMVFVENVAHTDMGVKNSFFISEAFGIGGYGLLIFSPVIVGISYGLSIFAGYRWMATIFTRNIAVVYAIPIFLLSMNLTGGFSSFPLLKGCILNLIIISCLWPAYYLVKGVSSGFGRWGLRV